MKVLNTTKVFIIYVVAMIGTYVFAAYVPTAPFGEFAFSLTAGLGIFTGKRLIQKRKEYTNVEESTEILD